MCGILGYVGREKERIRDRGEVGREEEGKGVCGVHGLYIPSKCMICSSVFVCLPYMLLIVRSQKRVP